METFTITDDRKSMSIKTCARCAKAHEDLPMKKFSKYPIRDYTHFTTCPNTKEPILIKILN